MLNQLLTALESLGLVVASAYDLRRGEVPDELSYALILLPLIFAAVSMRSEVLLVTLAWGLGWFCLAYIVFWIGGWGGADVKVLTAIALSLGYLDAQGALGPFPFPSALVFALNFVFVAILYSLIYACFLTSRKPTVVKEFFAQLRNPLLWLACSAFVAAGLVLEPLLLVVGLFLPLVLYLKIVETNILQREVGVGQLREGDMLAEDLRVGRHIIRKSAEGLTRDQLELLQKLASEHRITKVRVREGIRFIPALCATFLITAFGLPF